MSQLQQSENSRSLEETFAVLTAPDRGEQIWRNRAGFLLMKVGQARDWAIGKGIATGTLHDCVDLPHILGFLVNEKYAGMPKDIENGLLKFLGNMLGIDVEQWSCEDRAERGRDQNGNPVIIGEMPQTQHHYLMKEIRRAMRVEEPVQYH